VQVRSAWRPNSKSIAKAQKAGLEVTTVAEGHQVGRRGDGAHPDQTAAKLYAEEIGPNLKPGKLLMFAHGFNIHFKTIVPAAGIDVGMAAPKAPGHRVREVFTEGGGVPGLIAVHQDATGNAHASRSAISRASAARAPECSRPPSRKRPRPISSASRPCSAAASARSSRLALRRSPKPAISPRAPTSKCLHELKLIVDLIYRGGLAYMRYSISDTAEWGDYVSGPRVINAESRKAMKQILTEIQDGTFAKKFLADQNSGRKEFLAFREAEAKHPVEIVGKRTARAMPFLDPVTVEEVAKSRRWRHTPRRPVLLPRSR
jgi:ketol-acid reductoisomerase